MPNSPEYATAWAFAQALGIGFLIGSQRESATDAREETAAGIRDFILFSLIGAIAGLLATEWLTAVALLGIVAILIVHRLQHPERGGITTEVSAVATYWLGYLTQGPYAQMALALSIVMVALLSAKQPLHRFVRQTITEREYTDTLKFLAVVFIIYPLLPVGTYGPYGFFTPRQVWLFVILVSAVSYVGYFFIKFMGTERGLLFAGLLGGLASTTAATTAFARSVKEQPEMAATYGRAAVLANVVQFPRVLVILFVINPAFARAAMVMLLMMSLAGLVVSMILTRVGSAPHVAQPGHMPLKNPFSLPPALRFGALFTLILFLSKSGAAEFGPQGMLATSLLGGIVDVDAVAISIGDLLQRQADISSSPALVALLLALGANAVLKSLIAVASGTWRFAWRLLAAFILMFVAGGVVVATGLQ